MTTGSNRKRGRPKTVSSGLIFKTGDREMNFMLWRRKTVDLAINTSHNYAGIYDLTKEDIQTIIDKLEELKGEMK